MFISYNHSHVKKDLITKGYAELSIHSLNFDRYFTEEEKENNFKISKELTNEEWNNRCDEISKCTYTQLCIVIDELKNKYNIHQLTNETSTIDHYRTNWDLFYYSNRGWNNREWNNKDYFDFFSLTFNKKRIPKENMKLLDEIVELIINLDVKNVCCRVQYTAVCDYKKIKNDALDICNKLQGKMINYMGMEGKIKLINDNEYGFFKKGAWRNYYTISFEDIVLNY